MSNSTPANGGLILAGLDGSNPLAFLAALGTLRALAQNSEQATSVKMSWSRCGVGWAPVVHAPIVLKPDGLLESLEQSLAKDIERHALSDLGTRDNLRTRMLKLAGECGWQNRDVTVDWISALSSDHLPEATSQIQTTRRDYFFGNLRCILRNTQNAHLRRALFATWDYADSLDNQSLHLEPSEDRRHAYQWHKPSGDPTRKYRGGMLGANRLAIEAFPFIQSIPIGGKLSTRGFSGQRVDDTRWTWPIWSCRLGCAEVSSLLALPELQDERLNEAALRARGVAATFRSRRILVGKTPNFTPAIAVF